MAVWTPGQIFNISKSARAALGIIKSAVLEGWSRNYTQTYLSDHGMGVKREDLLSAYNYMAYATKDPSAYLRGDNSLKPRDEYIPIAATRQKRAYAVDVVTRFYDEDLGVVVEQPITVSEDYLSSQDDLLTLGAEIALRYGYDPDNILESRISAIRYSPNPIIPPG